MLLVKSMVGLGDGFAARPTIAALRRKTDFDFQTPWPELYADMDVRCVRPDPQNIRCAKRNSEETKLYSEPRDGHEKRIQLSYHLCPGCKSIPEQIAESAGVLSEINWTDFRMHQKDCEQFPDPYEYTCGRSPLAVFRIPTIRTEYKNEARNPAHGLVAAAVQEIGGYWIHLNDQRSGENVHHEESHPHFNMDQAAGMCEARFGELSLPSMLDLVSRARCVVTPVSWMAWAAMAYQVPTLCVWGGYCRPKDIFGPLYDMSGEYEVVAPEVDDFGDPCRCFNPSHDCAKSIPVDRVREAARSLK